MNQSTKSGDSSDQGVICNYSLDGNGGGKLQEGYPLMQLDGRGFDWLHLRSDDTASIDYMRGMNPNLKLIDALSADETRPRMQLLEDGVLVTLRGDKRMGLRQEFDAQFIQYKVFSWLDENHNERGYVGMCNDVKIDCWRALRDAGMTFSSEVSTGIDILSTPDFKPGADNITPVSKGVSS